MQWRRSDSKRFIGRDLSTFESDELIKFIEEKNYCPQCGILLDFGECNDADWSCYCNCGRWTCWDDENGNIDMLNLDLNKTPVS